MSWVSSEGGNWHFEYLGRTQGGHRPQARTGLGGESWGESEGKVTCFCRLNGKSVYCQQTIRKYLSVSLSSNVIWYQIKGGVGLL